jgi:molecular chaperone HtpG
MVAETKQEKTEKENVKGTLDIQGDISIHTENILPIIKKWLYSENEIFVRELISNAFDAITKLKKIATHEADVDVPERAEIHVKIDEKAKTVTISDNGLGLDSEDCQKYINQIAFSGATDFIEKYEGKEDKQQVIGHFGLGFYSSFIVSDLVEIQSLSYKKKATPIHWSCDGSTHFSIKEGTRKTVGTDIILHLGSDSKEYLNEPKLTTLVKKYANFLAVEIKVNDKVVNDQNPLWVNAPKDVKEADYKEFYQKLFPMNPEPLFWIHLNVDYPFNLKGILYFPKLVHELDATKGQIQLFCQQVFVTKETKEVVPEFLTLLQGAIDCPDIPLNVSRSYLQNDPYVRKISAHIVKKIADKLKQLYAKDRESFERYWGDINHFIKYGILNDSDFYEKVKDIIVFETTNGGYTTIAEYLDRNKEKLKEKVLYASDRDVQGGYVDLCKKENLEVIYLQSIIDTHFIQFLESKNMDIKYISVDSDLSEFLAGEDTTTEVVDKDNKTVSDRLVALFKTVLKEDALKIEVKSLKNEETPALITESEQSKRMKQMSAMMRGSGATDMKMPDAFTLVVNANNVLVKNVLKMNEEGGKVAQVKTLCDHVYDTARMNNQPLTGASLQRFISRSNQIMSLYSER